MSIGTYNIEARQGDRLVRTFTYADDFGAAIDLTGYTARMQVRAQAAAKTTVLDLDSAALGGLTITAATGTIVLEVSATDMAAITLTSGVYDLELVPPTGEADVFTLLEGKWTMDREVTR